MESHKPVIVVIPVRDEADRIGACVLALSRQVGVPPPRVLLLINNTVDCTADLVRQFDIGIPIDVIEHQFPPHQCSAGHARRLAMELAAAHAGSGGVVLTTDADSRVAPDWLSQNLRHIDAGLDAVAGVAEIDPIDVALIPVALHRADAEECAYAALLDEIDSLIDPDADDPWPRHTQNSGASICVRVAALRRAGGVPAIGLGEDRALFAALRQTGARIRHAPEVRVTVSGRLFGRAAGGMADTMRRRMVQADPFLDDALEPAAIAVRRSDSRAMLRRLHAGRDWPGLMHRMTVLACPTPIVRQAHSLPFGAVWAAMELHAPALARRPVPIAELPAEMAHALCVRAALMGSPVKARSIAA